MSTESLPIRAAELQFRRRSPDLTRRLLGRPELLGVLAVAAALNLWRLQVNGYANTFYAAAVKSMASSWHDFLYASMDRAGLQTIDKPPLAYWVQALDVRVFGYSSWSLLVPQAVMGVVAVGLMYDLVRRRFGRAAGFVAALVLATTPTIVAVSRHNNPDELLVLLSVAAVWFAARAIESGRTRHLVWAGVMVGLGFETKMGVALLVVPATCAAWLWMRPGLRSFVQLLWGGLAMAAVGLAWPLLVTLTPAADRPWISGTSDNSVWSLIVGYNGLGRIAGQTGGPPGGQSNSLFGGATGPFRLLQSGLGDQAGWLLGGALAVLAGLVVITRLRRRDPRTGFAILLGGTLLTVAAVFSFASGIFHPYYVSMLAPWIAALVGAGVGGRAPRWLAPAALAGGAVTELIVLGELNGQLGWAVPLVIVLGLGGAVALLPGLERRARALVLAVAGAALIAAPAVWAAETDGHATNGTFPTGGPASAQVGGPPGARPLRPAGPFGPPPGGGGFGPPPGAALRPPGGPGGFGAGSGELVAAARYAAAHGGGTVATESQSSAASAIMAGATNVAGIGGFSGRESSVSLSWLIAEVRAGRLRWLLADSGPGRRVTFTYDGQTVTMYDLSGLAP